MTAHRAVVALCVALTPLPAFALGTDQKPGETIRIDLQKLPEPYATASGANRPATIPKPADATLAVPPGFVVNVFADNLGDVRNVRVAPDGDVFAVISRDNKIVAMHDDNGKAKDIATFIDGFTDPYGLAFARDAILIGDSAGVWKIPYGAGDTHARAQQTRITPEGAFGSGGGHHTRNVVVSPDGTKIYVAIGAAGNIDVEPEPRATIQEFAIDGSHQRTFARGLRNPVGLAFKPGTKDLYTVVNERDGLGDELVPDYFTKVVDGGFYGWPWAYMGHHPQPRFAAQQDMVDRALTPDVPLRSHSAPLAMTFYTAKQFPAAWRGGAFVALHGSWNAAMPRGYTVVYVPFTGAKEKDAKPAGDYVVFASGFWADNESRADVWGRPAGVAVAKDGSLLIADDVSGTIWRVSYTGK